jgi:hypothetical protein
VIDERNARDFGIIQVGDQAHHAAKRLADGVEARLVAIRTALTIAGDRAVNQFRIQLRQLVIVEPELGSRRRAKIFQKDIRRRQEFAQDLVAFCLPQVQRNALFVPIERAETRAVAFVFRITAPVSIATLGQFDFNYLAAEIAEQTAGVGSGYMAADFDASKTLKSSGDHH